MVASYTQLLARRYQGKLDADADEFIGYAVDGAHRMQAQIQALLEYARVGRRKIEVCPTDTQAMVNQVLHDLHLAIETNGVDVRAENLPMVMADPNLLPQVFQNLISNALKFRTEADPRVRVRADSNANEWQLSVEDNGIGMDPKAAGQIFGLFRRLHSQAEYPGTGIGLAVCKRIVESHGGRIWVESTPGAGSAFRFTLPRIAEQTAPESPLSAS